MKKLLLIVVLLFSTSQITFAQQAIAKIKYNEAEDAYAKNDFDETIKKLDDVEALLKNTNPKVMYLRIMAQSKIIKNKYPGWVTFKSVDLVRNLSAKYLKDYENLPDNEDKYLDVYKTAEMMEKYPKTEVEFNLSIEKFNKEFRNKIQKKSDDYESRLKNMSDYDSKLISLDRGISVTLNSVLKKHNGKALVIVFWYYSSGNSSKELLKKYVESQTRFPNLDFVFVLKNMIVTSWENRLLPNYLEILEKSGLNGKENYLISNYEQFSNYVEFKKSGVKPNCIIVDKNGEVRAYETIENDAYFDADLNDLNKS